MPESENMHGGDPELSTAEKISLRKDALRQFLSTDEEDLSTDFMLAGNAIPGE